MNIKGIVKAIKAGTKAANVVYWAEVEGKQVVGTRHFLVKLDVMLPEFRAAMAAVGVYEVNTVSNRDTIPGGIPQLLHTWGKCPYTLTRLPFSYEGHALYGGMEQLAVVDAGYADLLEDDGDIQGAGPFQAICSDHVLVVPCRTANLAEHLKLLKSYIQ